LLEKVIDDHRRRPRSGEDGGDRDFVDVLLDVHNKDQEHGIQLETNEIKAIILVINLYDIPIHEFISYLLYLI
jgi:hypothetical protein